MAPTARRLTILMDLDGIAADLLRPWLRFYNAAWDDNLTIDDITDFEVRNLVKPEAKTDTFAYFSYPGVFRQLPLIPGAKHAVHVLNEKHNLLFCSSPPNALAAAEKYDWVEEKFGIGKKQVILCSAKEHVRADVLIDDKPSTAVNYRQAWPNSKVISIKYPYNQNEHAYQLLADGHNNTEKAWKMLLEYIGDLANTAR
jgi:5'(3')-deoxyribonucleotidase